MIRRRFAVAVGVVVAALALPGAVLADNCGDLADCWSDVLKASLAVAGAAILAGIPMLTFGPAPNNDSDEDDHDALQPPVHLDGPPDVPQSKFPQSNAYEPGGINARN